MIDLTTPTVQDKLQKSSLLQGCHHSRQRDQPRQRHHQHDGPPGQPDGRAPDHPGDGGGDHPHGGLLQRGQRPGHGGLLHVLRPGHRQHEAAGAGAAGVLRLPERRHHAPGGGYHLVGVN